MATAGIESSKTVTPSGTTPLASLGASRCSLLGVIEGAAAEGLEGDEEGAEGEWDKEGLEEDDRGEDFGAW
ncbi:hypothetical protein GCM10022206_81720 [Streptomyces chiangmaiensis]